MKECCEIELVLEQKAKDENRELLFADYILTREYLFKNIYPEIGKKLPDFTYHDGSHVINVLDNIFKLLSNQILNITCETLYFLCLSTLFHDVGLVFGRKEHQNKISEIYNSAPERRNLHKFGNEKIIISKTVEAHSGNGLNITNDTLENLGVLSGYSERINTQEIAAILKFADELAEGGQRTSDYFIEKDMYVKCSKIYHLYSQSYQSIISYNENKIAVTYNITIYLNNKNELMVDQDIMLNDFLKFIYDRIIKLDDERKYCKYYCQWLKSMKEISICFYFWYNSENLEIGLNPMVISDKIIPGDSKRNIVELYPEYNFSSINEVLRKNMEKTDGDHIYE